MALTGVKVYDWNESSEYNILVRDNEKQITWDEVTEKPAPHTAVLCRYGLE